MSRETRVPGRVRRRRLAVVLGVAAVVLAAGVTAGVIEATAGSGTPRAYRPVTVTQQRRAEQQRAQHDQGKHSVPAWAQACLPKGSQRVGPAPEYVGLTGAAAERLADKRGDSLVYAGGGGHCYPKYAFDLVYRVRPVALVFNVDRGPYRSSRATVVAAARAVAGWSHGWGLPRYPGRG